MRNLKYKSIDIMKKTKDVVNNQLSDVEMLDLVTCIIKNFNPTHIAISIPFDSDADFRGWGTTPSPRTAEAHYKKWCDTIHQAGCKVLHRGTWSKIEGIWGAPLDKAATPQGTAATAATDGNTTWLGKNYRFITQNPTYFATGDIWAPIPEPTSNAFNGNLFLSSAAPGVITNFANFFNDLKTSSDAAFTAASIPGVITGLVSQNYSEVRSGWIPNSIFNTAGAVTVDYYGNYSGDGDYSWQKYLADLETIYASKGQKLFWGEWGDLSASGMNLADRNEYFLQHLNMVTILANRGKLIGYNYWGGWEGQNTSILYKDGNGKYQLNSRGKMLAAFFNQGYLGRKGRLNSSGYY